MLVAPHALATAVRAALVRGPVVAVVETDRDAHRALAMGVDEVVRASEASAVTLARAAKSARLRSMGREARPTTDPVMD
ncbi:MAG: hypothetical protein M3O36_13980, partial [Myxococcota bacterium]|nr:hypothetical protein [Myxococcota bacterium]